MKIGNLSIEQETPLYLAPMAGVSDVTFRHICRDYGADIACTEMVSAKAILYGNKNTEELLTSYDGESPLAVQLFGSDPDIMAEIAARIEERFDIIDVNMGCPVAKIVNNREGSALMNDIDLAEKILCAMAKKLSKPLTVKFRIGFNKEHINAVEFAKMAEGSGVSAIAVHARTRDMYYSGKADWDMLRKVKQSVNIPVFGNGDIFCGEDAKRMKDETGVDGLMIARGAQGHPWIFAEARAALSGATFPGVSPAELKKVIIRHAEGEVQDKGEYIGIREMRKHLAWYTKGFTGAAAIRNKAVAISTMEELVSLVNGLYE